MANGSAARKIQEAQADAPVSFQTYSNAVEFAYDSIEDAFPTVEPGRKPFGNNVLVQVRQPKTRSKGGILLSQDARSTEHYNTRVAKVVALGPICFSGTHTFKDADGEPVSYNVPWAEGPWFVIGDYVEIPQYGGSRFVVPFKVEREEFDPGPGRMVKKTVTEEVTFAFFKAKDVIALITANPLSIKSYTD